MGLAKQTIFPHILVDSYRLLHHIAWGVMSHLAHPLTSPARLQAGTMATTAAFRIFIMVTLLTLLLVYPSVLGRSIKQDEPATEPAAVAPVSAGEPAVPSIKQDEPATEPAAVAPVSAGEPAVPTEPEIHAAAIYPTYWTCSSTCNSQNCPTSMAPSYPNMITGTSRCWRRSAVANLYIYPTESDLMYLRNQYAFIYKSGLWYPPICFITTPAFNRCQIKYIAANTYNGPVRTGWVRCSELGCCVWAGSVYKCY